MRVAGGIYRSRKLESPQGLQVRPTANMVKEALMNILGVRLRGARVLDLFCGSGQMGIECISWGAESCVFADNSQESCKLTSKNLALIGIDAPVMRSDWEHTLTAMKARGQQFDIIIADPPYKAGLYEQVQKTVLKNGVLADSGVLVLEHDKAFPPTVEEGFEVLRERSYGKRCLLILCLKTKEVI